MIIIKSNLFDIMKSIFSIQSCTTAVFNVSCLIICPTKFISIIAFPTQHLRQNHINKIPNFHLSKHRHNIHFHFPKLFIEQYWTLILIFFHVAGLKLDLCSFKELLVGPLFCRSAFCEYILWFPFHSISCSGIVSAANVVVCNFCLSTNLYVLSLVATISASAMDFGHHCLSLKRMAESSML